MKIINIKLLASVSLFGVMMSLPYLIPGTSVLALAGLIPLFFANDIVHERKIRHEFLYYWWGFLLWNALTTFWVCNATIGGGIFAITANSLVMTVLFSVFAKSKKYLKGASSYIFFAALWITYEKVFHSIELSWPWLALGNAFAKDIFLIQWYEFTGSRGGTLWILISNIGLFLLFKKVFFNKCCNPGRKIKVAASAIIISVLFIPPLVSLYIYSSYKDEGETLKVAILQPNFNPYEKFSYLSQDEQNEVLYKQLESCLVKNEHDSTILAVAPETFFQRLPINDLDNDNNLLFFANLLSSHKNSNLIIGASSYEIVIQEKKVSPEAVGYGTGAWLIQHNSAVSIDGRHNRKIYHKSKLVPGVELLPFASLTDKLDEKLGRVAGRCVGQKEISLLSCNSYDENGNIKRQIPVGCIICYESVYGDYCRDYIKKGAQVLAVITNDAWWGNTPGYKQHLSYSSLRAIETRRYIARSANTGISAIIDPRGRITKQTKWWERSVITSSVKLNDKITFFVRNGDATGNIAAFIFLILSIFLITKIIKKDNA